MKQLKIIIKIILVLFMTAGITSFKAQKSTKQDFLLNKKWHMYQIIDVSVTDEYGEKTVKHYCNGNFLGEEDYYLSNKLELFFDKSKIGKIKKGKYIICRVKGAPENKAPTILEIIKGEGNELILKNMVQEHYLRYRIKE